MGPGAHASLTPSDAYMQNAAERITPRLSSPSVDRKIPDIHTGVPAAGGSSPPHPSSNKKPKQTNTRNLSKQYLRILRLWVENVHLTSRSKSVYSNRFPNLPRDIVQRGGRTNNGSRKMHEVFPINGRESKSTTSQIVVSDSIFPLIVEVTDGLETALKGLDMQLLRYACPRPPINATRIAFNNKEIDLIIKSVARIKGLMKTMLLINNQEDMKRMMSYKIMRRTMMSIHSIKRHIAPAPKTRTNSSSGNSKQSQRDLLSTHVTKSTEPRSITWLVKMIKSGHFFAMGRAVDYLEILSNLTLDDFILNPANKNPSQVGHCQQDFLAIRDELFKYVGNLRELIPAVASLPDREIERASVTKIMQRTLDYTVRKPFGVTVILLDLVFHILLLFGWRLLVMEQAKLAKGTLNTTDKLWSEFLILLCFLGIGYFLFRTLAEMISMLSIGERSFRRHFLTFGSVFDLLTNIMAFVGVLMIRNGIGSIEEHSRQYFTFCAFTTFLLWFQFVRIMKVLNRRLATFVLAINQILRDVFLFFLIILVGIIGFGDTFFTILEANIDACPENFFNRVENTTVANYENEIENPFCSENHFLSYVSIYRIMLGDLQFELFEDSIITIILFIFLTFFGIVIFINMLITLVDESYEKATLHIDRLFGRARVLMASTIISLEELLQPFPLDKKPCTFSSASFSRLIMRLLCIALMSLSGFVIIKFWHELEDAETSKAGTSLSLVFLVIPGFLTLGVFFSYFVTGWANARPSNAVMSLLQRNIVTSWLIFAPILFVSRRVLGTSEPSSSSSERWGGRLSHIDRSIKKAVARSTKDLNKSISDISKRLAQLEQNTRTKTNAAESSRNIDVISQDGSQDRSVEYSMIESTLKELDSKRQEEMEELEKKLIGAISNMLGDGQRSVAYTATDSGDNAKDYSSDDSSGNELL
eukprot:scaffold55477_cov57-Attheya_sp.AAC.3